MSEMHSSQRTNALALAFVATVAVFVAGPAFAGTTGTELQGTWELLEGVMDGYGGKIAAGLAGLVGLVVAVAKNSVMPFAVGAGVGLVSSQVMTIADTVAGAMI